MCLLLEEAERGVRWEIAGHPHNDSSQCISPALWEANITPRAVCDTAFALLLVLVREGKTVDFFLERRMGLFLQLNKAARLGHN